MTPNAPWNNNENSTVYSGVGLINSYQATDIYVTEINKRFKCKNLVKQTLQRRSPDVDLCEKNETINEVDRAREMELYSVKSLNADQRLIWEYVRDNTKKICLIQAGPGCGKSFVLKTIAYNHPKANFESLIYKHDLLAAYRYCTRRFTIARFMMRIMKIQFMRYTALEKAMSFSISTFEFMLCMTKLLQRSRLPDFRGSIVFLDEYSVMSKSFLVAILTLLEHHGVGAVVCGDRNQLQNIHNSKHALLSAYDLAHEFAHKTFNLYTNERCSDELYNELVSEFIQFNSDGNLNEYTYAMLAALFPKQCIAENDYNNIHLAAHHSELAQLMHTMVCTNKYATSFYSIDKSNVRSDEDASKTMKPLGTVSDPVDVFSTSFVPTACMLNYVKTGGMTVEKFLPYLPLVIGARYYIGTHTEYSQCILEVIADDYLIVRMLTTNHLNVPETTDSKTGSLMPRVPTGVLPVKTTSAENAQYHLDSNRLKIVRGNCNRVMFDQHREYLIGGERGTLYNFPIYPINFMSIHKCQGCTITNNVDLLLCNTTYQGLYVALSRVTNPSQIARVVICDQVSNLASAIANIPEMVHTDNVPVSIVRQRMAQSYIKYSVSNEHLMTTANYIIQFLLSPHGSNERHTLRIELAQYLNNTKTRSYILSNPAKVHQQQQATTSENAKMTAQQRQALLDKEAAAIATANNNNNNSALYKFVKFRKIFLGLSQVPSLINQCVWLHEFLKRQPNDIELILKASKSLLTSKAPKCNDNDEPEIVLSNYDDDEIDSDGKVAIAPPHCLYNFDVVKYQFQAERDSTTLVRLCDLRHVPAQDDDIMAYIQYSSATKMRNDIETIKANRQRCVERINDIQYLENEEFACRVYHLYRRNKANTVITVKWLVDQLNDMLAENIRLQKTLSTDIATLTPTTKAEPDPNTDAARKRKSRFIDTIRTRKIKRNKIDCNDALMEHTASNNLQTCNEKIIMDAIKDATNTI